MTKQELGRRIGDNVRAEIARHGKTQEGASALLGLPQASISKRINGRTPWQIAELLLLAEWLDVPISDFLTGLPRLDSNQEPAGYLPSINDFYFQNPKSGVNLPPRPVDTPGTKAA